MPLKIVQASNTSTTNHDDLCKLIALSIDASRSDPLTRCMLGRPDSYASHKQYAELFYTIALDNDETRIFMALNPPPHDLGAILGSVLIEHCRLADPIFIFERRGLGRLDVNRALFEYIQTKADKQRREVMERDYYSTFHRDDDGVRSHRAPLIPRRYRLITEYVNTAVIAAPIVSPTHPLRIDTRMTLVSHAVAEIRKTDLQSDIVAQLPLDSEGVGQVYPQAEGWDHSRRPFLVLDPRMFRSLGVEQRSLKMLVNWGSGLRNGLRK